MTRALLATSFCTALTLAGIAFPQCVLASEITCPAQILVHEQVDPADLSEWRSYDSSPHEIHHFYAVAFSQGPPEDRAYLNPQKVTATPGSKSEFYEFGKGMAGDLWISCLYRDTSQTVSKRIDPKPSKCRVSYDPVKALRSVKTVRCD